MRTVAVVSQKGGAGNTTLALHMAVAAEQAGYSAVVIDMDPQGTAEAWSEWRKEAPPVVIPAKTVLSAFAPVALGGMNVPGYRPATHERGGRDAVYRVQLGSGQRAARAH